MTTCPCGAAHNGPRAPFDLAAALTTTLARDAAKPDAATLRTHMRCLLGELRGLCSSCTFALAAEMAEAARAEVQAVAAAVAQHAKDLAGKPDALPEWAETTHPAPLTGARALATVHPLVRRRAVARDLLTISDGTTITSKTNSEK